MKQVDYDNILYHAKLIHCINQITAFFREWFMIIIILVKRVHLTAALQSAQSVAPTLVKQIILRSFFRTSLHVISGLSLVLLSYTRKPMHHFTFHFSTCQTISAFQHVRLHQHFQSPVALSVLCKLSVFQCHNPHPLLPTKGLTLH